MEFRAPELAEVEAAANKTDEAFHELSMGQLALVGGGHGDVSFN